MTPLASYDRISACGLSCQLVSGRHPSDHLSSCRQRRSLAKTQASSAAQHQGSVSDRPGQPANTTFRCLRAGREPWRQLLRHNKLHHHHHLPHTMATWRDSSHLTHLSRPRFTMTGQSAMTTASRFLESAQAPYGRRIPA